MYLGSTFAKKKKSPPPFYLQTISPYASEFTCKHGFMLIIVSLSVSSFFPRYSIERVFRHKKLDRAHPRELLECAFDIITPVTNSLLPDAETIYTISEIVQEFPGLQVTHLYCLHFK